MQSRWLTRYLDRMRPGSDRVQIADDPPVAWRAKQSFVAGERLQQFVKSFPCEPSAANHHANWSLQHC